MKPFTDAVSTAREDAKPVDFGPPSVVEAFSDSSGEMLLQLNRPKEAVGEFKRALALARETRSYSASAAEKASGDAASAKKKYAEIRSYLA